MDDILPTTDITKKKEEDEKIVIHKCIKHNTVVCVLRKLLFVLYEIFHYFRSYPVDVEMDKIFFLFFSPCTLCIMCAQTYESE